MNLPRPLLLGLLLLGACNDANSPSPPHSVSVTVTDSVTKAPLVNVPIALQSDTGRFRANGVTNATGQYRFTDVPAGPYQLSVEAPGYPDKYSGLGAWQMLEMPESVSLPNVSMQLQPFARIRGVVRDQDGAPLSGVGVEALRCSEAMGEAKCGHEVGNEITPTGRGGGYLIDLLPGKYLLVVYAPRPDSTTATEGMVRTLYPSVVKASESEQLSLASGEFRDSVNVSMASRPVGKVSGVVRTAAGPVNRAGINLFLDDTASQSAGLQVRTAEVKGGHFVLAAVPAGKYVLESWIESPTGDQKGRPTHFGRQAIVVGDNGLPNVTMTLGALPRLRGRLAGAIPKSSGDSAIGLVLLRPIDVGYVPSSEDANLVPMAMIRADGHFEVNGIRPGRYLIGVELKGSGTLAAAMANGIDVSATPLRVEAGATLPEVVVTMSALRTELHGVVQSVSGDRVPNACVLFFPSDSMRWDRWQTRMASMQASIEGRYLYAGLPPGDYAAVAIPGGAGGADGRCPLLGRALLRGLLPRATRLTLKSGGQVSLDLSIVLPK